MQTIELHSTDVDFHRGFARRAVERQSDWLVSTRHDLRAALNLPTMYRKLFVAAVLADDRDAARGWLNALAIAAAAGCRLARGAGTEVTVTLQRGSSPTTFSVPEVLPVPLSPIAWEEGFWASFLASPDVASETLGAITALTPQRLVAVNPPPAPHPADLARMQAWRGLVVDDVDIGASFIASMEAHGDSSLKDSLETGDHYGWWLYFVRGREHDATGYMRQRDAAMFAETFTSAVEEHRDFWKRGGSFPDYDPESDGEHRALYDRGLVSLSLLGLARRARKVGLSIPVQSPYVPAWLYDLP